MSEYYAYRINLTPPQSKQPDVFKQFGTKEEEFSKVFDLVATSNRIDFVDWGTKFMVFHFQVRNENIHIWELAKDQQFKMPVAGETTIDEVVAVKSPYVFLIFHIQKQIVFIERNSEVFATPNTATKRLETFFDSKLSHAGISVAIEAIKSQKEFWEEVEEFDKIEDVRLEFDAPNWWGSKNNVDDLINDTYEASFFEKLKISFKNTTVGLKFTKDKFGAAIERLSAGTGNFLLKGKKNGEDKTIVSEKRPFKKEIEDIKEESNEDLEKGFNDAQDLDS